MNVLQRISAAVFGRKSYNVVDLAHAAGLMGVPAAAGVRVGRVQALQIAAVFGCLRVLGEGVAQVPFKVMRKTGRSIEPATDHPAYDLLANQPNDWMTSFELRELLVWHAALCGAAYCYLVRDTQGRLLELLPLPPGSVQPKQAANYDLTYQVTGTSGEQRTFPASSIWALRGPTWNGFEGLSVLQLAREALGLSIAAERHHAHVHKNSAQPSGLYSFEGTISPEQHKTLRAWVEKEFSGLDNVGRPMILDRSAKFTPFTQKGVDMQHLETRNHQVAEVCRFFRVNPLMIGYSDKAVTYASAEQQFLSHLVHTLMPWYSRIEQSANAWLLTAVDRRAGYYTKFTERGLLRGAMKDEAEYLSRLVERGVLTRNEARELMDRNPIDGLDEPLTPINLTGSPTSGADNSTGAQNA